MQPEEGLCIIGDMGLLCHDPRLTPPDYTLTFVQAKNFVAVSFDDYNAKQEWVSTQCWGPPLK